MGQDNQQFLIRYTTSRLELRISKLELLLKEKELEIQVLKDQLNSKNESLLNKLSDAHTLNLMKL